MGSLILISKVVLPAIAVLLTTLVSPVIAHPPTALPTHAQLTRALAAATVAGVNNGGIFTDGGRMWASVVDRHGQVVAVAKTPNDPWPGSRVISMQKAYTANAFSNSGLALSTANLNTAVQPGGSLYGLQHSNPVNPGSAYRGPRQYGSARDPAVGKTIGGVNVFGGGLPLYDPATGKVVGAIGVSGDSSCADHNIAWRIRHASGYTKVPGGVNKTAYGGAVSPAGGDDNIIYTGGGFGHPGCGFGEGKVTDLPSMSN